MLGIVHHSPIIVSIILERESYIKQHITESEARDGSWIEKITEFTKLPKDGRQPVLFVERLSALQSMLRDGFDPSPFKVVLFDDLDHLSLIKNVNIIDAKWDGAETWRIYKLMPPKFNEALSSCEVGVVDGIQTITPPKPKAVEALESVRGQKRKGKSTLANADEVMQSIVSGVEAKNEAPEAPEQAPEPEPEPDDLPPPPRAESAPEAPQEAAEVDTEVDTKPVKKTSKKPKKSKKSKESKASGEDKKADTQAAKRPSKPKPKAASPESHKLF